MRARVRQAGQTFLALILCTTTVAAPFLIRQRNVAAVREQYESLKIGGNTVPSDLKFSPGPPPVTYQNYVWWETVGRREACSSHAVKHGAFLAGNVAYIVGRDRTGRVAFKQIGNT